MRKILALQRLPLAIPSIGLLASGSSFWDHTCVSFVFPR